MATLLLTTAGSAIAGPFGGAIGAVIGQRVDGALFGPKPRQGPRLGELAVQTSSYGTPIPKLFGTMRVAGTVIWATDLVETRSTTGGKGRPKTIDYSYAANFAVALSARPIQSVGRIWADGKLLRGAGGDFKTRTGFRLHPGDEDQAADPLIVSAEGAGQAPAFRGTAYAVFEGMELAEYGNRIPSLSFEVTADAGAVAIAAIARELAPQIVAAAETPAVGGYAAGGDSVRGAIEELAELHGLGLCDDGAELVLGDMALAEVRIPAARETARRERTRGAAAAVPAGVAVSYYDPARDYQAGLQRAERGAWAADARIERRGLAAALSAETASRIADARLDALWRARERAKVTTGWWGADLRPGRRVRLANETEYWRISRATIGAMTVALELELERVVAAAAAGGGGASAGRPVSEADEPHGPTTLRLLDLPIAEMADGTQPTLAVVAAGVSPGWRGARLSVSIDGGVSYTDIGDTAAPAIMGAAATALAPGQATLFDREHKVEVDLLNDAMVLTGCDDDALVRGENLALIGDELVQFGDAVPLGAGRYRLSRLLRGRRGTEWAMGEHQAGEGFTLIAAGTLRPVVLPAGAATGSAVQVLASGVGDDVPVPAEAVAHGAALLPPAPVHLSASVDPDGGATVRWIRRSRNGWSWRDGADTPIGEEREAYLVTISGPGVDRGVETNEPRFHYSAAARAADGPGPILIRVRHLGDHGRSRAASLTL